MKYIYTTIITAFLILISKTQVYAQYGEGGGGSGSGIKNPLKSDSIQAFVSDLLGVVIQVGVVVVVLMIIFAGFKFVTAQGAPDKISEAKRALFWALIGGLIVLGARAISEVVSNTVDQLTFVAQTFIG